MSDLRVLLLSTAIALGAVVCGLILNAVLAAIVSRVHSRTPFSIRGIALPLSHWRGPFRALIPALALAAVLPFLRFPGQVRSVLGHVLALWVIGALAWVTLRTIGMARDMILSHYQLNVKDNLRARRMYTQLHLIDRVLTVVVLVFTVSIMLMTFREVQQVGVSILASAGVIGIILGFAAQRSLATLFAGIQIAISQPIRLDDVVIVENEWGWIEEVTLMYVVVRIWDQRRLIVPITYFMEKPFQNWTRTSAQLLGTVFVYADYAVPVQEVREELHRILDASPLWDKRVWGLQVTNATERAVELRALISAADSSAAWDLRCHVREKLIEYIQKRFPDSLPRLRVEMESDAQRAGLTSRESGRLYDRRPGHASPAGRPQSS